MIINYHLPAGYQKVQEHRWWVKRRLAIVLMPANADKLPDTKNQMVDLELGRQMKSRISAPFHLLPFSSFNWLDSLF